MYAKFEYLERIFYDAAGVTPGDSDSDTTTPADYTHIEGYCVTDYNEQPHKYVDNDK